MKIQILKFLILYVMLLLTNSAYSAKRYVENVAELKTKINLSEAGDSVILKDGIYSDFFLTITNSGSPEKMITIMAENEGKARFGGDIGIKIKASYVKFNGFSFEGATLHPDCGIDQPHPPLIESIGSYNVFEDMYIKDVSNGPHHRHVYILLQLESMHNLVNRCWFERKTQAGMAIKIRVDKTTPGGRFHVVENCYFKAMRQKGNGGSSIRIGTGLSTAEGIGKCVVKNCLFDEYNGEGEITCFKSSGNVLENNTFLNCHGSISLRHCHNNIVRHNYIITTDTLLPEGGTLSAWGEGHQIYNNYFYGGKSDRKKGGAVIAFATGTGTEISAAHEQVENILVKDNIIYKSEVNTPAISFGYKYKHVNNQERTLVPKNITVEGNSIYSNVDLGQIYFKVPCEGIVFKANKVYKKPGLDPLPKGIKIKKLQFKLDNYGIYRIKGKGPKGRPLNKNDVGPQWLKAHIE